jgi:flagellar basal body-associated protein FliL
MGRVGNEKMSVNIKEANLEAMTHSIAFMEKDENCDKELLKKLKEERNKLLKELNVSI